MNSSPRFFPGLVLVLLGCASLPLLAQEAATPPVDAPATAVETATPADTVEVEADDDSSTNRNRGRRSGRDDAVVAVGDDAFLAAGESTNAVVAILGSATSEGDVRESVVSILGNTRSTGTVGESTVAILGNVYVNGRVDEDVVAILGNVELGPDADIGNDIVIIGGSLMRDAAARVDGQINSIFKTMSFGNLDWARAWIENCLVYARPLAIAPGLGWAWTVALVFLAFYVVVALLFGSSVEKCVQTMETRPGPSLLAAVLTVVLTPILFILLVVTVIGIAVIPFLAMALFLTGLFGKLVMLAWLGRRGTRFFGEGPWAHPAAAVLLGGIVVLGIYLVPVLGFIVYKLLGIIGLGVVVYTLLLAWQAAHPPVVATATAGASGSGLGNTSAAIDPGATAELFSTTAEAPTAPLTPTALDTASLPRAGFWIRMAALFIDAILLGILTAFIDGPGSVSLILLAIYGAVMWKLKATTIGGIVCGLKVIRLDGRPIDWPTAVVRALGCFLSLVVAGLGFIWVIFDEQKQSWHDKIAGTTIVRMPKGVSLL